jgi:hypothetical protein
MTKSPSVDAGEDDCWAVQGIAAKNAAAIVVPQNCLKNLIISHLCERKIYHKLRSAALHEHFSRRLCCCGPVNRLQRAATSQVPRWFNAKNCSIQPMPPSLAIFRLVPI